MSWRVRVAAPLRFSNNHNLRAKLAAKPRFAVMVVTVREQPIDGLGSARSEQDAMLSPRAMEYAMGGVEPALIEVRSYQCDSLGLSSTNDLIMVCLLIVWQVCSLSCMQS